MIRQMGHVRHTLAQGWHTQWNHVQPVVEIFPKLALSYCLGEIAVGGSDHADVKPRNFTVPRRALDRLRMIRIEPIEHPQGMQLRPPVGRRGGQLLQRRRDRRLAALDEQPLCGVAPPSIRMRERLNELRGRCRRQ